MVEQFKLVHHKHPNGTTYVYEISSNYWDSKKKQSRNNQVCIGKIDPHTGELISSRRFDEAGAAPLNTAVTARTSVSGPSNGLEQDCSGCGAAEDSA